MSKRLGPHLVLVVEALLTAAGEVLHAALERLAQLEHALLALAVIGVDDLLHFLLERAEVLLARLVVTQVTMEAAK
jgi:hypothetical protein